MRSLNKDEIFAVLLIRITDSLKLTEAIEAVAGREFDAAEISEFYNSCAKMRNGWVRMDITNRIKKEKPRNYADTK